MCLSYKVLTIFINNLSPHVPLKPGKIMPVSMVVHVETEVDSLK